MNQIAQPLSAGRWIGRVIVGVLVAEGVWGLIVSLTRDLIVPFLARQMEGVTQSPENAGNINVPGIAKVYANWQRPQADALQAEITTVRKTMQAYPMVPALKRVVAHFHNDPAWTAVRPPMLPLSEAQSAALIADLAKIGFTLGERRQRAA